MRWLTVPFALAGMALAGVTTMAADLGLYAAGSLKAALSDVATAYQEQYGTAVAPTFAASGLLRERIEGGETPDVFASALRPGAFATLDAKALQLTGGPDSEKAPEGRNTYAWVMEQDRADLFLTYCTNAVLAQEEVPGLQIVALPEDLSVGADYGLLVRKDAPPQAWQLALFILSPEGQAILAGYGFTSGAQPQEG